MPSGPKSGESWEAFFRRCVSAYKDEGLSPSEARKRCGGMWYGKHPDDSKEDSSGVKIGKSLAEQ